MSVAARSMASGDVIIEWNVAMTHHNESQPPPGAPPLELRAYAMAHVAMFNAVSAAVKEHAVAEAAAAQAAHDVLVKTLPAGRSDFEPLLTRHVSAIPHVTLFSTMGVPFPDLRPRTFHRISDAAVENALSRVFAGIHFRQACLAGLAQGRMVGAWVVQHAPFTAGR